MKYFPNNAIESNIFIIIASKLACNDRNAFFTSEKKAKKNIMHGHVKMYVKRWPLC